jgi:hypothetical protein
MNDTRSTLRYPGFRFPAEIISHGVWLYHGRSTLRLDWIPTWGSDPIPRVDSDAEPFDRSNLLI